MGVDGVRLDAVPYLIEREGTNNENLPETHAILKRIRAELDQSVSGPDAARRGQSMARGRAALFRQWRRMPHGVPFSPDAAHVHGDRPGGPLSDHRHPAPDARPIPPNCQWAIFLRNHDELTLEMVTDDERDYLWRTYASDRRARLNLGIRRRLAPLLERDRRRIELMNCLLLSMPGTPVIYYGDEIGMGDNIHLGDRDGVRTPMQWTPDRNGGFSRADPGEPGAAADHGPALRLCRRSMSRRRARDPHSLLNWMRRMLAVRRSHRAFGRGALRFLYPRNRQILAYLREYEDETILCVANLARTAQAVELDLAAFAGRVPVELTGGVAVPADRPADLPADAAALWLLLVRAPGLRRSSAGLARRAARTIA